MSTASVGGVPNEIATSSEATKLDLYVIYTGGRSSLSALRDAAGLASRLNARIRIVLPVLVRFPLGLDEPPAREGFHRRILRSIAAEARIETVAEIAYCREYADLNRALPPHSIVVIGGCWRWWRLWGAHRALADALIAGGHHIIPIADKENSRA